MTGEREREHKRPIDPVLSMLWELKQTVPSQVSELYDNLKSIAELNKTIQETNTLMREMNELLKKMVTK